MRSYEPERADPALRFSWLKYGLGLPDNDPGVVAARADLVNSRLIGRILAKQNPDGSYESPDSPYLPKYKATYWRFIMLGHPGAGPGLPGVDRVARFIFSLQEADGSWSTFAHGRGLEREREYYEARCAKKGLEPVDYQHWAMEMTHDGEITCLTGNIAASLIRMGLADSEVVRRALDWLAGVQFTDGGWKCPFWKAHIHDTHSCFAGTACALEALALYPSRSEAHEHALGHGCEFLLAHRLFRADHHGFAVIKPRWLSLFYPWRVDYNILRGLYILSLAGVRDDRAREAIDLVAGKRRVDGFWAIETPGVGLEKRASPSPWTTLKALETLRGLGIAVNPT